MRPCHFLHNKTHVLPLRCLAEKQVVSLRRKEIEHYNNPNHSHMITKESKNTQQTEKHVPTLFAACAQVILQNVERKLFIFTMLPQTIRRQLIETALKDTAHKKYMSYRNFSFVASYRNDVDDWHALVYELMDLWEENSSRYIC